MDLTNFNLTGDLDVSDFSGWEWNSSERKDKRTQIIINGNPNLGKIIDRKERKTKIFFTRAQEFLDYWYPSNGTCLRKNEKKSWDGEKTEINNFEKEIALWLIDNFQLFLLKA